MPCRSLLALAVLSAPLAFTLTTRQALADSVTLYTIDHSSTESFTAGDGAGDYVISDPYSTACGGPWGSPCFKSGTAKTPGWTLSTVAPTLSGTGSSKPFNPSLPTTGSDWTVFRTLGFLVSAEYDDGTHDIKGIFDGTDPFTDFLSAGSIDGGINAGSTVFYIDSQDGTLVAAMDTTTITPEPSTLTLLGTGLAGATSLLRRRARTR